jgi:hypothetical protein
MGTWYVSGYFPRKRHSLSVSSASRSKRQPEPLPSEPKPNLEMPILGWRASGPATPGRLGVGILGIHSVTHQRGGNHAVLYGSVRAGSVGGEMSISALAVDDHTSDDRNIIRPGLTKKKSKHHAALGGNSQGARVARPPPKIITYSHGVPRCR